jgi:tetratricopeptide (TPR) repeat protein
MTSQALFQQAVSLHQQGQLAEAATIYRRLLADAPADFQLQYRLALLLFQQQCPSEAMAAVKTALAFHPDQPDALMLRGTILASAGRREEALGDFDRVLGQKPDHPGALFNRALVLFESGRHAEAVKGFERFLAKVPDSAEAWVNRGAALQELGRHDDALSSYGRALTLNPAHGLAWQNRGTLLKGLGRLPEALESFDKAVALMPRHAGAWRGRGVTLMNLLQFDEALKCLDRALEIVPGEPALLKDHHALVDAMRLFAGMPADADPAEVWHHRAAFLQIHRRLEDSLQALDQALAIQPDYLPALIRKGQVLTELGRTEDGMTSYRRHAEAAYGGTAASSPADPEHKQRHDRDQRDFLAAHGIRHGDFHLDPGARVPVAVNPANAESAARQWRESNPQIAVIDNLLTPEALEGLRLFCRGSTMWRRPYRNGYLGAMPEYGFACPLLAQIADELREMFPSVIAGHGLCLLWGFKYDSRLSGIPMHADQAAVNVNFWIAPEDANRDPESGGLVVWPVKPPTDWDFDRYNKDEAGIRAFLAKEGAKPVVIPHRANRAVVFDSDLFHETDRIDFAEGYLNRRINVTMLYGRRSFHGG